MQKRCSKESNIPGTKLRFNNGEPDRRGSGKPGNGNVRTSAKASDNRFLNQMLHQPCRAFFAESSPGSRRANRRNKQFVIRIDVLPKVVPHLYGCLLRYDDPSRIKMVPPRSILFDCRDQLFVVLNRFIKIVS